MLGIQKLLQPRSRRGPSELPESASSTTWNNKAHNRAVRARRQASSCGERRAGRAARAAYLTRTAPSRDVEGTCSSEALKAVLSRLKVVCWRNLCVAKLVRTLLSPRRRSETHQTQHLVLQPSSTSRSTDECVLSTSWVVRKGELSRAGGPPPCVQISFWPGDAFRRLSTHHARAPHCGCEDPLERKRDREVARPQRLRPSHALRGRKLRSGGGNRRTLLQRA